MSIISLHEAYSHLKSKLKVEQRGAENILSLAKWAAITNDKNDGGLIAYIREENNIGYTTERYRSADKKRNFLVIGLTKTAYHPVGKLHLDVYLGKENDSSFSHMLEPHSWLESRRLVLDERLEKASGEEVQGLFRLALRRRFSLEF